jgi:hypothetical protein
VPETSAAVTETLAAVDAAAASPAGATKAAKPRKPEKGKSGKDKAGKGKADKGKGKDQPAAADGPTVAAHPRAARSVTRVKGWGGLVGFLVAGYLSLPTSTAAEAGMRALIAGAVCYVACWGAAVFVWRRIVVLEIKAREQKLLADVLARQDALARGAPAGPGGRSGARDAP